MIYKFNTEPQNSKNKIYVVMKLHPDGTEQPFICSWDENRRYFITSAGNVIDYPAYYAEITPTNTQV